MKKNYNVTLVLAVLLLFAFVLGVFNAFQIQITNMKPNKLELANITTVKNSSDLEREANNPQFFSGTFSLSWVPIPNATGYEIEFNYDPIIRYTKEEHFYCTGAFYAYNHVGEEQFRIRSYYLKDEEKIYSEFSAWIDLNVR